MIVSRRKSNNISQWIKDIPLGLLWVHFQVKVSQMNILISLCLKNLFLYNGYDKKWANKIGKMVPIHFLNSRILQKKKKAFTKHNKMKKNNKTRHEYIEDEKSMIIAWNIGIFL